MKYCSELRIAGCGLDCATLTVPLRCPPKSAFTANANILLVRYNATVDYTQFLGSLLVNPEGPRASGVSFAEAGAISKSAIIR